MNKEKVFTYSGEKIDITWDGRLCIHIAECGRARGDFFVAGRDPWCQPDRVTNEEALDVVKRCPSGALAFSDKTGSTLEAPATANTVQVVYNGPLFVSGDLDIEGAPEDMSGVRYRAALCRCGLSDSKPFCDNSHLKCGFSDYGAVGESGEGVSASGGKLEIRGIKDGPLMLSGNFAIRASSGRDAWTGTKAALCRCGQSENKPFCDGSHSAAGFTSD